MRIKKFVASSLKEATEKMKQELGENAIVLNTRSVPATGIFSLAGKQQYEITGAIDDDVKKQIPAARKGAALAYQRNSAQHDDDNDLPAIEALKKLSNSFERERTAAIQTNTQHTSQQQSQRESKPIPSTMAIEAMQAEMDELKQTLHAMMSEFKTSRGLVLPMHYKKVYDALMAQEVSEKIAMSILQPLMDAPQGYSAQQIIDESLRTLASIIPVAGEGKSTRKKTKVIAIVGPTGVGKTTTIAKLSAIFSLVKKLDVGLISADTYRIAAIDQLQTFATIASIDMDVAYKPKDMPLLLKKHKAKDIIFIDTAGRNQRNPKELQQIEKFLRAAEPDETHLVLSTTSSLRTLRDVVKRFAVLKPNRFIFSKLDEASAFGNIINIAVETPTPISYLTLGQQVPDDILAADANAIAHMMYSGEPVHG